MNRWHLCACFGFGLLVVGCGTTGASINPFTTLTETFGITSTSTEDQNVESGLLVTPIFRRTITVTFRNNHPTAELNTLFVAWVSPSSIRSAQQQDALFADGYNQLTREVRLGSAITLPVGTLVYNGGGVAGGTTIFLNPAQTAGAQGGAQTVTPTSRAFTLITPDGILAYAEPPVSCDSTAFVYTRNRAPLTSEPVDGPVGPFAGSNTTGGFKTLAQVNLYQCEPLKPGVFLRVSGARKQNEYLEGENITFDFYEVPDAQGNFGIITIGS